MDEMDEYATLRRAGGPVARTAALRSLEKLKRAIALAGGRVPRDHAAQPLVWSEARGWQPRAAPRTLEELTRRQHQVEREICLERLAAEMNAEWRRTR